MSWQFRKPDRRGRPRLSAVQRCVECGARLVPEFKAGRDPDDWFWPTCDRCGDPVCPSCSDVDDDGKRTCLTCLQESPWKEQS